MKYFEYTNKGNREENQDYIVHGSLPENSDIFIVADGMGGYSNGAIAAKIVSDAIVNFVELNFNHFSPTELLKEAVLFSNDTLLLKRMNKKMGCVIVVMLLMGGYAYFTWLGDSRLYLFRCGREVYRTKDHSFIEELSKMESFDIQMYQKYSAIVTKSIMGECMTNDFPINKVKVEIGDVFILCTDGFHKNLDLRYAVNFNDFAKKTLDGKSMNVPDNLSFIKVEI